MTWQLVLAQSVWLFSLFGWPLAIAWCLCACSRKWRETLAEASIVYVVLLGALWWLGPSHALQWVSWAKDTVLGLLW